jgi:hypothetical protein
MLTEEQRATYDRHEEALTLDPRNYGSRDWMIRTWAADGASSFSIRADLKESYGIELAASTIRTIVRYE